jgi:hypothetical protein
MKTYTAVEIATKLKIPRTTVINYLAHNARPVGTATKKKHLSWIYDREAVNNLSSWYKNMGIQR